MLLEVKPALGETSWPTVTLTLWRLKTFRGNVLFYVFLFLALLSLHMRKPYFKQLPVYSCSPNGTCLDIPPVIRGKDSCFFLLFSFLAVECLRKNLATRWLKHKDIFPIVQIQQWYNDNGKTELQYCGCIPSVFSEYLTIGHQSSGWHLTQIVSENVFMRVCGD